MLHTIGIRVKEIKITVNHNPSSLRGKNRKKKKTWKRKEERKYCNTERIWSNRKCHTLKILLDNIY